MNAPSPTATIQSLYAAFGRGDIPTILAQLREDIDWHANVAADAPGVAKVPTFRARRGPRAVGEFFAELGTSVEFHSFEPVAFLAANREVAVRLVMEFTIRSTGKRMRTESMHHWTLDEAGKVTRFVEFLDTLGEAAAWNVVQVKL